MLIAHQFPLQYYLDNTAENSTDYEYCSSYWYLNNEDYKNYIINQAKRGRILYLDNSVFEIGRDWTSGEYASLIEELKPSYYMLPSISDDFEFNIESQISFYNKNKDLPGLPIYIPHAETLTSPYHSIPQSIERLEKHLPKESMLALSSTDDSFNNKESNSNYFNERDFPYLPLRRALNRNLYLKYHHGELSDKKIHLLGCESLAEFNINKMENPLDDYDKSNIITLSTNHPIGMALENFTYSKDLFKSNQDKKHNFEEEDNRSYFRYQYKPTLSTNSYFKKPLEESKKKLLKKNIEYFQSKVREWSANK